LKPGGHLLAFGGSRTYHRLACAVEDAGFEIRDQIMWVYGSGFPKSLDVSKAIDKMAGEPVKVGKAFNVAGQYGAKNLRNPEPLGEARDAMRHEAISHDARRWKGWGTALKPAHEPIVMARKPLKGTVVQTVLEHGTGGINIDACRIDFVSQADREESTTKNQHEDFGTLPMTDNTVYGDYSMIKPTNYNPTGRWPANFIHDGSDEVLELFPEERQSGSAARFFYCAKASRAEREAGLDDFNPRRESDRIADDLPGGDNPRNRTNTARRNHHPTVKPIALMRYLIRLVTPPGAVVLDPFTGSGTTGIAAALEGCEFVGIEQSADYAAIAEARIAAQGNLT
jgi:site-specific DNA-methyltransferase (adenine-specific)